MAIQTLFFVSKRIDNTKRTTFSEIVSEYESGDTRLITPFTHRIAKSLGSMRICKSIVKRAPSVHILFAYLCLLIRVCIHSSSHFVFVVANRDSSFGPLHFTAQNLCSLVFVVTIFGPPAPP